MVDSYRRFGTIHQSHLQGWSSGMFCIALCILLCVLAIWGLFDCASSSWINWNANLMQQGNFINVFLARHVSGTYAHHHEHWMLSCSIWFSAPYTRPTQLLSRPPPIQKLGAENHMLQLNIQCSWWWAYVPETCRAKYTLIKLPCCIKLTFQVISVLEMCGSLHNIFQVFY